MGGVEDISQKRVEKKYKDILSYKELINKVDEFEERLKQIKEHTKNFDDDMKTFRDKEQKKVFEF